MVESYLMVAAIVLIGLAINRDVNSRPYIPKANPLPFDPDFPDINREWDNEVLDVGNEALRKRMIRSVGLE